VLAGAALAACGGSSGNGSGGSSGGDNGSTSGATITISGFDYGAPVTVSPGATVTVVNKDSAEHTVTADTGDAFDDDASGGATSSFKAPSDPGKYKFHCSFHDMHGALTVSG
jgi:plastocyanin